MILFIFFYRIARQGETTKCEFKMFQSTPFTSVAFTTNELKYWAPTAIPENPYKPTLVRISSQYEAVTILDRNSVGSIRLPSGCPGIAARKPNSEKELSRALSQCKDDLRAMGSGYQVACEWWDSFIGRPSRGLSAATGLFAEPDQTYFDKEASFSLFAPLQLAAQREAPTEAGRQRAFSSAVQVPHLRTVNSSISRAERAPPPHAAVAGEQRH